MQKLQKALLFAIVCRFFVAQSFVLAAFATLVCQRNCGFSLQRHKTREFGEAEFSDCLPVSAFASGNSYFINSLVQKLQNSAQAEFWDCTPVLAFETGIFFGALAWGFWEVKAL